MRDDGDAAGRVDPADRIVERSPLDRDVAGLAFDEVVREDLAHVVAPIDLDDVAGEVGPPDQVRIADVVERTLERVGDADPGELRGHLARAARAARARAFESGPQRLVVGIDAKTDDVQRLGAPRHRDLDAGNEGKSERRGGGRRPREAAELVVIGQGPQLHALRVRAPGQFDRLQGPVGDGRVAMEVGVEGRGVAARAEREHRRILRSAITRRSARSRGPATRAGRDAACGPLRRPTGARHRGSPRCVRHNRAAHPSSARRPSRAP